MSTKYDRYISSKQWAIKRREAYNHFGYFCQRCGENRKGFLSVHHKHYKTLGNEDFKDLGILCRNCHSEYHSIFGKDPDPFTFDKFISWRKTVENKKVIIKKIRVVSVNSQKDQVQKLKATMRFRKDRMKLKMKKAMDILKSKN